MTKKVTLRHPDGSKETVLEWSLRHYELRHMGYKEVDEQELINTVRNDVRQGAYIDEDLLLLCDLLEQKI